MRIDGSAYINPCHPLFASAAAAASAVRFATPVQLPSCDQLHQYKPQTCDEIIKLSTCRSDSWSSHRLQILSDGICIWETIVVEERGAG
jgi:hypothetical protein